MTDEEKDLIQRAQDIQRYTENRCESLEKRIAELEEENAELKAQDKEQVNLIEIQYAENQTLGNNNATLIHKLGELSEQIEKMKCCGNCKNCIFKYDDEDLIFECDVSGTESYTHLKTCTNWELAE